MNEAEKTFLSRMAFHMEKGLSFDEAARAVIGDDRRLHAKVTARTDEGAKIREAFAASIWMNTQARAINKRFSA